MLYMFLEKIYIFFFTLIFVKPNILIFKKHNVKTFRRIKMGYSKKLEQKILIYMIRIKLKVDLIMKKLKRKIKVK